MNCSLDKLIKNLSDEDFKYLSGEFCDEQLKLVKEKGIYPYDHINSFKRFKGGSILLTKKFLFFIQIIFFLKMMSLLILLLQKKKKEFWGRFYPFLGL